MTKLPPKWMTDQCTKQHCFRISHSQGGHWVKVSLIHLGSIVELNLDVVPWTDRLESRDRTWVHTDGWRCRVDLAAGWEGYTSCLRARPGDIHHNQCWEEKKNISSRTTLVSWFLASESWSKYYHKAFVVILHRLSMDNTDFTRHLKAKCTMEAAVGGLLCYLLITDWMDLVRQHKGCNSMWEKTVFSNNGGSPRINTTVPKPTFQHISPTCLQLRLRHDIYVPPHPSFETHKGATKEQLYIEAHWIVGLNVSEWLFQQRGNKANLLDKVLSPFAFCMLTFLQGRTETEAQNSRVMQLRELLFQFVLGFETKHLCQPILSSHYLAHPLLPLQTPYKTPLSLWGEKTNTTRGAGVLLRDSFIQQS